MIAVGCVAVRVRRFDIGEGRGSALRGGERDHRQVAIGLAQGGAEADAAEVQVRLAAGQGAAVLVDRDVHEVDGDGDLLVVGKSAGQRRARTGARRREHAQQLSLRSGNRSGLRERQIVGLRNLGWRRAEIEDRVIDRLRVGARLVPDLRLARGEAGERERSGSDSAEQHRLPPRRMRAVLEGETPAHFV